ncbi:hypothetical protein Ahy_A08g039012 isoform F [Arachis hypogaea]|uniref:PPC domain-containing protein n=1 Tax=Arachis hypogaea TaxID=3818 RepID=A0A445BVG8_ARAHY|nr:hypothetical protein Ahy_A08g039012 isoform F [Arachis hypogaea]
MPRTQLSKIDGLREIEDFGRTVPLELTVYPGEGDFEILSLSGHFVNEEDGSVDWRLGITLADSDSDKEAFGGSSINTLIASDTPSNYFLEL